MTHLKIGDKAPDFQSVDQEGNPVNLKGFTGKKVILYFYPRDNTPGCTVESCNLRDNYAGLREKGYEVIGVSSDTEKSHQKFIKLFKLPFTLLADTDKEVIKAYGIWGEKKFMGRTYHGIHRTTFVISEDGIIEDIITKVKTTSHADQILGNAQNIETTTN